MRPVLLVLTALLLITPAPALALPGDAPLAPLEPADGATLPVDAAGVPASYQCPTYRSSQIGDFPLFGGPGDYTVGLATSSTVGADGRLVDRVATNGSSDVGWSRSGDVCSGRIGAGGSVGTTPQETPGTYFWQVWRLCVGCDGSSYEVGPVRRFELRSNAVPRLGALRAAYASFPVVLPLVLTGVPTGAKATVERKAGGTWQPVGAASAVGEAGTVIATFGKAGKETLRVSVAIGSQTISSGETTLTVKKKSSPATTTRRDDGKYADAGKGIESLGLELKATKKGRELRDVKALVPMTCPGIAAGQFTTQIGTLLFAKISVAPDGRFVAARTVGTDTAMFISGRLKARRISEGVVRMSVGTCSATRGFAAKRR